MREIKFEIKIKANSDVDGYKKGDELIFINNIFDKGNGVTFVPINSKWDIVYKRQYTGLKDKNGKEIYEGDVVQHDAWDYPFEVVFDNDKARFVCKMKTTLTQYINNEKLEVIGNIYENPELLNN